MVMRKRLLRFEDVISIKVAVGEGRKVMVCCFMPVFI